jgi:hypothetical protein
MEQFTPSDLRDPQPPLPGESERAKVAARAHELGRRRRLVQGGGALALVAAVAVSVAALTGGGGTGPGGTNRVEAASADTDTTVSTPVSHVTTVPTTVAPAPTTVAPAPAPAPSQDTTPAATSEVAPPPAAVNDAPVEQPAAPTTFTLSGSVTGNPANTSVSVLLVGPDGSQTTANCDAAGNFSISDLAAGDYQVIGTWTDNSGDPTKSAAASVKFGTVSVTDNTSVSFSF